MAIKWEIKLTLVISQHGLGDLNLFLVLNKLMQRLVVMAVSVHD